MDSELYADHDTFEDTHWWFLGRRQIILDLIRRRVPAGRMRLLDVGCGTGANLREFRRFGEVFGLEGTDAIVQRAVEKSGADVRQGWLPDQVPFSDSSFDVITALDVIEHIDDDVAALKTIHRLLQPGGILICTVPAFQFLWSGHDVVNQHKRRYTVSWLRRSLTAAGFGIELISYYNVSLFPVVLAARLLNRIRGTAPHSDFSAYPRLVNRTLTRVFAGERHLLGRIPFPFGVSVVALATKQAVR